MTTFKGNTENADAPILGAAWWEKGKKVAGRVLRSFKTVNGQCYVIHPLKPLIVAGEECENVSIGALTGFLMALQDAGVDELLSRDLVVIECTGIESAKPGQSPRPNFSIEVDREEADGGSF